MSPVFLALARHIANLLSQGFTAGIDGQKEKNPGIQIP
jgi:hypothetical protein